MSRMSPNRIVHMELHTHDLPRACAFYAEVCGWRPERIRAGGARYWALELNGRFGGGGVVECGTPQPLWLPYVEVADVACATERARTCGAVLLLEPREGPAGRSSVVRAPAGAEIAFWEPKHPAHARGARASRTKRRHDDEWNQ